jgi:hypothetical protein
MRISRVVPALAAAVLTLGLLAGCGDKEESASASASSDASPAALLTQETFPDAITAAMADAGSVHTTVSGSVMGQQLSAEGDQVIGEEPADNKSSLTMSVMGMDVELRVIDQVVYLNLGQMTQDKFATIDLTDTSNPLVAQFGGFADQADIAAQVDGLSDAITGFEPAGDTETVDGVETQPYTVTVDPRKIADAAGQDAAQLPDSFEYTFFVGTDDSLPRRAVIDISGQPLTLDFTEWGEDVSIETPSADQLTELDFGQLLGGSTGA